MENFRNTIILASKSPRRIELLEKAGFDFTVIPSLAEEATHTDDAPHTLAMDNAKAKAEDVAAAHPDSIVLGSDTIVVLDGKIYGKPKDLNDARKMIAELQGKTHSVFTAVALIVKNKNIADISCDESRVTFKPMSPADIENYLSKVHVLDKAGSYAAQEFGELIIEKIDGAFDNVMGLPIALLKKRLDTILK